MDAYIAGQILGFVSYGLGIATFYQKNDKRLKILMLALNVNHLVHFLLLGSLTSALAAALSAVRTTAAIYTNSKIVALIFIALSLLLGGMIAEDLSQLWPILGAVNWYVFAVYASGHCDANRFFIRRNVLVNKQHYGGFNWRRPARSYASINQFNDYF